MKTVDEATVKMIQDRGLLLTWVNGLLSSIDKYEQRMIDVMGTRERFPFGTRVSIHRKRSGYTEHSPPPDSGRGTVIGYIMRPWLEKPVVRIRVDDMKPPYDEHNYHEREITKEER